MSADEDVEKVSPFQCPGCGHVFMVPMEPSESVCPRCGYCVECV